MLIFQYIKIEINILFKMYHNSQNYLLLLHTYFIYDNTYKNIGEGEQDEKRKGKATVSHYASCHYFFIFSGIFESSKSETIFRRSI